MGEVETLLVQVLTAMVTEPKKINIEYQELEDNKGKLTRANITVAKSDVGMVIGRNGVTAKSLRQIFCMVGYQKTGQRFFINVDSLR